MVILVEVTSCLILPSYYQKIKKNRKRKRKISMFRVYTCESVHFVMLFTIWWRQHREKKSNLLRKSNFVLNQFNISFLLDEQFEWSQWLNLKINSFFLFVSKILWWFGVEKQLLQKFIVDDSNSIYTTMSLEK